MISVFVICDCESMLFVIFPIREIDYFLVLIWIIFDLFTKPYPFIKLILPNKRLDDLSLGFFIRILAILSKQRIFLFHVPKSLYSPFSIFFIFNPSTFHFNNLTITFIIPKNILHLITQPLLFTFFPVTHSDSLNLIIRLRLFWFFLIRITFIKIAVIAAIKFLLNLNINSKSISLLGCRMNLSKIKYFSIFAFFSSKIRQHFS